MKQSEIENSNLISYYKELIKQLEKQIQALKDLIEYYEKHNSR